MTRGQDFGSTPGNGGSPLHVMAGGVIYGGINIPRSGLVNVGEDTLQQEATASANEPTGK